MLSLSVLISFWWPQLLLMNCIPQNRASKQLCHCWDSGYPPSVQLISSSEGSWLALPDIFHAWNPGLPQQRLGLHGHFHFNDSCFCWGHDQSQFVAGWPCFEPRSNFSLNPGTSQWHLLASWCQDHKRIEAILMFFSMAVSVKRTILVTWIQHPKYA